MQELFALKEDECKKQSKMNKLIRWIPKRIEKKVDAEVQTEKRKGN